MSDKYHVCCIGLQYCSTVLFDLSSAALLWDRTASEVQLGKHSILAGQHASDKCVCDSQVFNLVRAQNQCIQKHLQVRVMLGYTYVQCMTCDTTQQCAGHRTSVQPIELGLS